MKLNYPVRVTNDLELIDSHNKILIPSIIYNAEYNHKVHQTELINYVMMLINRDQNEEQISENTGNQSDEQPIKRGRGRPRKNPVEV